MSVRYVLNAMLFGAVAIAAVPATAAEVVLTVRAQGDSGAGHTFTMQQLEAMPQQTFKTTTVWTAGAREFSGPSLKMVLEQAGVTGAEIHARALNNYIVQIPVDSLSDEAPIIATRIDGAPFPVREKGPLWVIYPYDSTRAYQSEVIYGRSIWQLTELTVR